MKEIILTSGDKCIVDDEDYDFLNQFVWGLNFPHNIAYASTNINVDGKSKTVRMHNLIMLPPKWHSQIMVNRKQIHLGYFDDIFEAAKAYNCAALKYYGEYARINTL